MSKEGEEDSSVPTTDTPRNDQEEEEEELKDKRKELDEGCPSLKNDDEQSIQKEEQIVSSFEKEEKNVGKGNNETEYADEEENKEESSDTFLHNLCILPPLQKRNESSKIASDAVLLPSIQPSEPVNSIRAALSEIRGYAHLTNFRLVAEKIEPDLLNEIKENTVKKNDSHFATTSTIVSSPTFTSSSATDSKNSSSSLVKKKKKKKGKGNSNNNNVKSIVSNMAVLPQNVVSPYTLKNAVIKVPALALSFEQDESNKKAVEEEELILDDYGDLTPFVSSGVIESNKTAFRIVLEEYTVGSVKDHVKRVRTLLEGSIPLVDNLTNGKEEEESSAEAKKRKEKTEDNDSNKEKDDGDGSTKKTVDKTVSNKQQMKASDIILPDYALDQPVSIDSTKLENFFHLSFGEEEQLSLINNNNELSEKENTYFTGKCAADQKNGDEKEKKKASALLELEEMYKLNGLESRCHVKCPITYSGFNPPPSSRRLLGDLAYLEVNFPENAGVVHLTATPHGFYVNRTTGRAFDPTPASQPCFSHALLDCLLLKSNELRVAWVDAQSASHERAKFSASPAFVDNPLKGLFQAAVKGDYSSDNEICVLGQNIIDSVTLRPSWIVPSPGKNGADHGFNTARAEEELSNYFGLDLTGSVARDWNEELQSAREMSVDTLEERIERARFIQKTLNEFGDAAVAGARAIFDGHIIPMNPNEPARSHVYLHNNIFFSRAVDAGADTFKIAQGDKCARKSANRDAHCVGTLHKLDISGLYTLATVLIDYLGTRLVCQSIVPGILQGEKTHTIIYGTVEATSPLVWNKEFHASLEEHLGKGLMIAVRKVPTLPLTEERMKFVESIRTMPLAFPPKSLDAHKEHNELTTICGAVEMKGIKGSDQRNYCLDLARLTPRDANWLPKVDGGTGHWESIQNAESKKLQKNIPTTLEDDEWLMAVLRPELITDLTRKKMRQNTNKSKKAKEEENKKRSDESNKIQNDEIGKQSSCSVKEQKNRNIATSDSEYMDTLRMNLNVFLPHLKSVEEIDTEVYAQLNKDEDLVREAASYLWKDVLPSLTMEIREDNHQVPVDGRILTDYLHQRGVNCRYLGRLATLALDEESKDNQAEKDLSKGLISKLERRKMPACWLELLECEMVARAAKHVLNRYLTENGGWATSRPAYTICSFLSAIMSTAEESAADTEKRLMKDRKGDEESNTLTMVDVGVEENAALVVFRRRSEIWADIDSEIGRRFRYYLHLYNSKDEKIHRRALFIPLLRRLCQMTGIRLQAKNYEVGVKVKGLCDTTKSYPIASSNLIDVLPLVKHASGEGFVPCAAGAAAAGSSLHILLADAKIAFEAAQVSLHTKNLPQALDLVQEATSLYQRVVDSPLHIRISRCLDLTAVILFQAQEMEMASINAERALAVAIQIGGFDCAEAIPAHSTLCHILLNSGSIASGVKHIRASIYLMELLGGPHYVELSNLYQRLGTIYHELGRFINALRFYQEALSRKNQDRVVEGMLSKTSANILAILSQFKAAFETEKRSYRTFLTTLGEEHELTKNSLKTLKNYMKMTLEEGMRSEEENEKRKQEEAADAVANEIQADESLEKKKRKKKKPKKKKGN